MADAYPNTPRKSSGQSLGINSNSPFLRVSPYEADNKNLIGVSPDKISREGILSLGHPTSPIKAIRAHCLGCCGSESEVRKCTVTTCPLWPLRMGKNIYHKNAITGG